MSVFDPNIPLPSSPIVGPRMPYLLEIARGARILHIGCVDAMVAEERLLTGDHLHGRLTAVAARVVGVDIDESGIELLRTSGHTDLYVVDVTQPDWHTRFSDQSFDLLMASEVVEHLSNPGIFLDEARRLAIAASAELVVTVPNAFRVSTFRRLKRGIEFVHPDHNYWFSFHTITNLLRKHGWDPYEVVLYGEPRLPRWRRSVARTEGHSSAAEAPKASASGIRRILRSFRQIPERSWAFWLLGRSPHHADGLVVRARPSSSQA